MIREVQPQVLVTYDQFGGYGHPDHIQAHRVAMYAAQLAAVPSYARDLGEPWEIAKIYWGAMSESRMRESLRALREAGDTTTFEGMDPDGPLPPFVTSDDNLAAGVDGSAYLEQKMDALRVATRPRSPSTARSSRCPTTRATRCGAWSTSGSPRASAASSAPTGSSPTCSPASSPEPVPPMGARLAPVTLLAGIGAGVGTVAVYQWWWGLLLAAAATLLVLLATPAGWATRLPLRGGLRRRGRRCWRCPAARATTWSPRPAPATPCSASRWSCWSLAIATLPRPGPDTVATFRRKSRARSDWSSYSEHVRRTRRRGVGHEAEGGQAVVLILLVVLVMGVGGWVAAYAGANGKVPRGTTVAGIDIGGRDRTAAAAALARGLQRHGQDPITVAVGTVTTQVAPADAGLSVDYVATVAKALGPRSWDPRRAVALLHRRRRDRPGRQRRRGPDGRRCSTRSTSRPASRPATPASRSPAARSR